MTEPPIEEIEIKAPSLNVCCSCTHCKYNTSYANRMLTNWCTLSDDPIHAPRIVAMFIDHRLYSVCGTMAVRPEAVTKTPKGVG